MQFQWNRRWIAALILLLATILCFVYIYSRPEQAAFAAGTNDRPVLILAAGHGGMDGGAVAADGTAESQINLQITRRLSTLFLFLGQDTLMTRTDESDLSSPDAGTIKEQKVSDLKNRVSLINSTENGILISIHQNSLPANKGVHGAQVFYNTVSPAAQLAEKVQQSLNSAINTGNEKLCKPIDSGIYLMKEATVPAILVECGFMSNSKEAQLLTSTDYQKQLAAVIAAGYLQYQTKEGSA